MTSKERVLERERQRGRNAAKVVQANADNMTGTELNEAEDNIPRFAAAVAAKNMLERPVGFVCKSTAGRVVRLLQVYDSTVFTQEPEELPAQWGFKWSTDPKKAKEFIALSTSPYNTGDCCTYDGHVWRSGQDSNVWPPATVGVKWEDLGTVEEVLA
jgi:hypothetical protein